ncbi:MAG: hypothetical protein J1F38_01515 [Muribaculaceae bacterium]|nr:hypothetical protein [Muribaculaceae bacterium]
MESNLTSAKELSAMDLNNIKLDLKHTVLTPQYLEDLINNKNTEIENKSE